MKTGQLSPCAGCGVPIYESWVARREGAAVFCAPCWYGTATSPVSAEVVDLAAWKMARAEPVSVVTSRP